MEKSLEVGGEWFQLIQSSREVPASTVSLRKRTHMLFYFILFCFVLFCFVFFHFVLFYFILIPVHNIFFHPIYHLSPYLECIFGAAVTHLPQLHEKCARVLDVAAVTYLEECAAVVRSALHIL